MKKINGMFDFSTNEEYKRDFRGYIIIRNYYGMYVTRLENAGTFIMTDTLNRMKKIIRHDIEKGNEN